jgi:hypothetical protein
VVREGVGQGGEMTQALYAHMNNRIIYIYIYINEKKKTNAISGATLLKYVIVNVFRERLFSTD